MTRSKMIRLKDGTIVQKKYVKSIFGIFDRMKIIKKQKKKLKHFHQQAGQRMKNEKSHEHENEIETNVNKISIGYRMWLEVLFLDSWLKLNYYYYYLQLKTTSHSLIPTSDILRLGRLVSMFRLSDMYQMCVTV